MILFHCLDIAWISNGACKDGLTCGLSLASPIWRGQASRQAGTQQHTYIHTYIHSRYSLCMTHIKSSLGLKQLTGTTLGQGVSKQSCGKLFSQLG